MTKAKAKKTAQSADKVLAKLVQQFADAEAALQAHLGKQDEMGLEPSAHTELLVRARQKLLERETRQRQAPEAQIGILDVIPAPIALLDRKGVILVVNEFWRQFGRSNGLASPHFGVGSNYLEICDRATGECSEEARPAGQGIRQVLQGETTGFSLEYPCHTPTKQNWFRLMVTPVNSESRVGVVVMHIDVTERRIVENQLRQQEQQQSQLVRRLINAQTVAKLGSWETDLKSLAVVWSDETHRIFGTAPDTFQPSHKGFLDRVHAEDRLRVDDAFMRSLQDKGRHSIEHRIILPDGGTKTVEATWQVQYDDAGQPVRLVGTCQDITERKRAESEVRMKSQMLDQIGQAVIATDPTGLVTYANRFAVKLYGWSTEEMVGRNVRDFTMPKISPQQSDEIMARLNRGETWWGEFVVQNRSGRHFPVQVLDTPMFNDAGEVMGIIGISTDITERKATLKAMRESEAELREAQRVAGLGTWRLDVKTHQVRWSPELYKMFGLDLNQPPPNFSEHAHLFTAESWQVLTAAIKRTVEKGGRYELELETVRRDGSHGWMLSIGETSEEVDGKAQVLRGVVLDITGRKLADNKILSQLSELERWRRVTLGREDRILSLKTEINKLLAKQGQPPRYMNIPSVAPGSTANPFSV